jgi:peptide/nickel transport system permease protein
MKLKKARLPLLSLIIVVSFVVNGIAFHKLLPGNPFKSNLSEKNLAPGTGGILGTDYLGRDVLSRVMVGGKISLIVAFSAILLGAGAGTVLGLIAGYYGGILDALLMSYCEAMMSFPSVILAMLLGIALGPGFSSVIIAISLSIWVRYTKIIRGEVKSLKNQNYVIQAKVINVASPLILLKHIMPNLISILIVMVVQDIGYAILTESSLSFLGLSVQPPNPTWGSMAAEGRNTFNTAWWVPVFPSLAIVATVLSFHSIGEWINKKLLIKEI